MKKNKIVPYKDLIQSFLTVAPAFLKYQIITKILLAVFIFPLFWSATNVLIKSKGLFAVSNQDFVDFLFSPEGFLFALLFIGLSFFVILLEIGGYIVISGRGIHGEKESSFKEILHYNLKLFPNLLGSGGLLLLFYILVMTPLTGVTVSISFLENVKIPNFITGVIFDNTLYYSLYFGVLLIFAFLSFRWIFTFHFIVLGGEKPASAMKKSRKLMQKNGKTFLVELLTIGFFFTLIFVLFYFLWLALVKGLFYLFPVEKTGARILLFLFLFAKNIFLGFLSLFIIPFEVHHLTKNFYHYCENTDDFSAMANSYPEILEKKKPSFLDYLLKKKRSFFVLFAIMLLITSVFSSLFYEEIFEKKTTIQVVGHRGGGGYSIPENSLSSIAKSIEYGAEYVEIDVQRTKDGYYIINHDKNFMRMAGERRKPKEMTLAEIKQLDIGKFYEGYEGERVPTIEELLDFCKGRIGVFVELKGESADEKMADDVIQMIRERKMEKETVLMSLDYKLMEYVSRTYNDIDAGFTYFLAFGDLGGFESSFLILEEEAATKKALSKIHEAGKKAVVWTVNEEASMEKFIAEDVDAIITDDVKGLIERMREEEGKGTLEWLLEAFSKLP